MASVTSFIKKKQAGEKLAMLTVYDATFSSLMSDLGVDILLVGDSVGNTVQGHDSTVYVTIEDMVYHTQCVRRGVDRAFILSDLPFMSYHDTQNTLKNATQLMQAGANMVKLEGGQWLLPSVTALVERGIPVCGHLGLTPQSVNTLGGYKVQGKDQAGAQQIIDDALSLEHAGAQMIVLECVPRDLAKAVTAELAIPVIGIGAGPDCDGQVLVLYDMLGITPGKPLTFCKNFMTHSDDGVAGAISAYVSAVKDGTFPAQEHCFS